MITTVSKILENLNQNAGLEITKLEKSLKLTKKLDRDNLHIAIRALTKLGIIKNIDDEKIAINSEIDFIQGRVRCSSKGYCFVVREDQGEDIYIREANLNNAWHGDSVIVLITKQALKRRAPEGSIQCVLKRYNDILLAKVESDKTTGELIAYPLDDRIPVNIELDDEQKKFDIQTKTNVIYEININKYPIAQFNAKGSIIRELPLDSGVDGDIEILLSKNNISKNDIAPKVSPKRIPLKGREDLTSQPSLLFQSWESLNAPFLPAIFAQPHEGGHRVWIHAPTVAERLNIGGKLDKYLMDKGEVTCLGNNWLQFLNDSLKSAAQFKVNEECESITLMLDFNSQGDVIDWKFSLGIIKPVSLITLNHLKAINNRKSTSKSIPIALRKVKDNLEDIYTIIHLSKVINQNYNGCIKLEQHIPNLERINELNKTFPSRDFNGWSKSFDPSDPQSIIDLYIRLSNNILAKHLIEYKLPFIYKEYEEIDNASINELTKSALALDNNIKIKIDGSLTIKELIDSFENSTEKKILHKLVKHLIPGVHLKLFKYIDISDENDIRNELSVKNVESPWCCPSLNYWNIFNQFIISSLLNEGKNKNSARSKVLIELGQMNSWENVSWDLFSTKVKSTIDNHSNLKLIQHLNEIRKQTKSFRNNIIAIAQCRQAQSLLGKEVTAIITGVQSYGFFAEIENITSEGLVHVSTLGDDWYEYRSRQNILIGRKYRKTYQLAQKVNVKIIKVDMLKNQIDLELVKHNEDDSLQNSETTKNISLTTRDK